MDEPTSSLPTAQAAPLLSHFTTFLTVTIHSLLYHRSLYPPSTFLTARAYNLPVHQSRHPGVCTWITDAVTATAGQLHRGAAEKIVLAIHAPPGGSLRVLERWVFDVGRFPDWSGCSVADFNYTLQQQQRQRNVGNGDDVNWSDVSQSLRGALLRISTAADKMPPLPDGCTFTLAVELRDEASAPIDHSQEWIPSEPAETPFKTPDRKGKKPAVSAPSSSSGGTTPIRSVQAGPLFFECYVQHGKPYMSQLSTQGSALTSSSSSSSSS